MTKQSPTLPDTAVDIDVLSLGPQTESPPQKGPHDLECLIQRRLQAHPSLRFTRLTVHKCPQGVCLEGLLESNDDGIDLSELVHEIAGVQAIDHVVVRLVRPK